MDEFSLYVADEAGMIMKLEISNKSQGFIDEESLPEKLSLNGNQEILLVENSQNDIYSELLKFNKQNKSITLYDLADFSQIDILFHQKFRALNSPQQCLKLQSGEYILRDHTKILRLRNREISIVYQVEEWEKL